MQMLLILLKTENTETAIGYMMMQRFAMLLQNDCLYNIH